MTKLSTVIPLMRRRIEGLFACAVLVALFACSGAPAPDTPASSTSIPAAEPNPHVAGADCSACHAPEADAWRSSHHAHALEGVDVERDAARFDGQRIDLEGISVTPMRQNGGLSFEVKDRQGIRTFPVSHTIGVEPLQQYLLQGDGGRLLISPVAWETAKGQWFDPALEGASGDASDPLYWAGITGTWNHMCAECHVTDLKEGFDPTQRTYTTQWSSLGVGCAACHGAVGVRPITSEIDTCGSCHARREPIASASTGTALLDHVVPTLLDDPVFTVDGGLTSEEAFEIGPFLQSRMHAKGVQCTDCHDPHSTKLRAEGNAVCTRCHEATTFDTPAHHKHGPETGATECITCHMPARTYMGVDVRHDHHIRVPDPVTASRFGERDPCRDCHQDDKRVLVAGPNRDASFTALVAGGRARDPQALPGLLAALVDPKLAPFRRASVLALLRGYQVGDQSAIVRAASDPDPLVRLAALDTLSAWGSASTVARGALADPIRAVRIAALKALFGTPLAQKRAVLAEAVAMAPHLDSPATWTNLAVLRADLGDLSGAEGDLRTAIAIEPRFTPARQNLAVLLFQSGRRGEAEALLRGE